MKQVVIDTNALISFVTDRNYDQQEKMGELLEAASHLKVAILCHQNVLTEFIFVMVRVYNVSRETIRTMVMDLIDLPGVTVVHDIDYKLLLSLWPNSFPDLGDAILAALCKTRKHSQLATFDRKFAKSAFQSGLKLYQPFMASPCPSSP